MKRIGLTQRVEVVANTRERRDCLDQNWAILLCELNYIPVPLANSLSAKILDEYQLEGVILTGGNDLGQDIGRDLFEKSLIQYCIKKDLPVLGVCRGAQMLNQFYGGKLVQSQGHKATRHMVQLQNHGPFTFLPKSLEVNSYHNFAISHSTLAKELQIIALAQDESIEGFFHTKNKHYAIMWHPEREKPFRDVEKKLINMILG